ncbi:tellurite resistance TerB C-terminal domain-containing protein [Rhizobium sp. BK176]|uniref:tellurite resistance TerB C-terminal domain-containing protein n=1 Tax=Rhizobium sp. BK176 TaxID=2587071 RepID=UPI00216A6149|nr:tellurite resistance TerB C-terminal domain-containing protein [Rhizobium sp. BK176]MCS4089045.1 stress response protein SCP2 [Rhizobium sp. BK176]
MEFKDVTPIMVLGETRVIRAGKLIVAIGSDSGAPISRAPDIALVLLDNDKKPLDQRAVVSSVTQVRRDRGARHLVDVTKADRWHGIVFEISTLLMPAAATAVSIIADGIDALSGSQLSVTLEDGVSRPHVFTMKVELGQRTAVIASVYRHDTDWKMRAFGHGFSSDRQTLAEQFGIGASWPPARQSADQGVPHPPRPAPPTPRATPSSSTPRASTPSSPPAKGRSEPAPAASPFTPPPIDMSRLADIERDTAAVSTLLSDIFSDVKERAPMKAASPVAGLDVAHAAVLRELMARGSMPNSEFAALARNHGLMPSGAAETINEWAIDKVSDIVVVEEAFGFSFVREYWAAIEALSRTS